MYTIPNLEKRLIALVEENFEKFSGPDKTLEIIIEFYYGPSQKTPGTLYTGLQHIKVIFYCPNGHPDKMTVAYDFDTNIEDMVGPLAFAAENSCTWKQNGLNFYNDILEKPEAWKILSTEIKSAEIFEEAEK